MSQEDGLPPPCATCGNRGCLRHCLWCGADEADEIDDHPPWSPPHSAECPYATGIYPAKPGSRCRHCGEPMDVYVVADTDRLAGVDLCLGCAVRWAMP